MTSEKDIVKLENENRELKKLLADTLKAFSILSDVVERYNKMTDNNDTKIFENDENVKRLLEKYSRL